MHSNTRADGHLLLDLEGGSQRLGEDSDFGRNMFRDKVKILRGKSNVVSESPVTADDSQNGTPPAMGSATGPALRTLPAHGIDLAHYATPHQFVGTALHHPYELMSWNPAVRVVTLHQLEVRVADPGEKHANLRLSRGRDGERHISPHLQLTVFQPERPQR